MFLFRKTKRISASPSDKQRERERESFDHIIVRTPPSAKAPKKKGGGFGCLGGGQFPLSPTYQERYEVKKLPPLERYDSAPAVDFDIPGIDLKFAQRMDSRLSLKISADEYNPVGMSAPQLLPPAARGGAAGPAHARSTHAGAGQRAASPTRTTEGRLSSPPGRRVPAWQAGATGNESPASDASETSPPPPSRSSSARAPAPAAAAAGVSAPYVPPQRANVPPPSSNLTRWRSLDSKFTPDGMHAIRRMMPPRIEIPENNEPPAVAVPVAPPAPSRSASERYSRPLPSVSPRFAVAGAASKATKAGSSAPREKTPKKQQQQRAGASAADNRGSSPGAAAAGKSPSPTMKSPGGFLARLHHSMGGGSAKSPGVALGASPSPRGATSGGGTATPTPTKSPHRFLGLRLTSPRQDPFDPNTPEGIQHARYGHNDMLIQAVAEHESRQEEVYDGSSIGGGGVGGGEEQQEEEEGEEGGRVPQLQLHRRPLRFNPNAPSVISPRVEVAAREEEPPLASPSPSPSPNVSSSLLKKERPHSRSVSSIKNFGLPLPVHHGGSFGSGGGVGGGGGGRRAGLARTQTDTSVLHQMSSFLTSSESEGEQTPPLPQKSRSRHPKGSSSMGGRSISSLEGNSSLKAAPRRGRVESMSCSLPTTAEFSVEKPPRASPFNMGKMNRPLGNAGKTFSATFDLIKSGMESVGQTTSDLMLTVAQPVKNTAEKALGGLVRGGSLPTDLKLTKFEGLPLAPERTQFQLSELQLATDNFAEEHVLGQGGFGKVYKGVLPVPPRATVAIKVLRQGSTQGDAEFMNELELLSRVEHKNLVKLLGFCLAPKERVLVYQYLSNGSLHDHLHGKMTKKSGPLSWERRVKIATGSARGLRYLHQQRPQILHRDIKSSNILLTGNFDARVSDFGCAKLIRQQNDGKRGARGGPEERIVEFADVGMGTVGHMAPEVLMSGELSAASDVYSFGVVLLELLTGKEPVDVKRPKHQQSLVSWAMPLLEAQKWEQLLDPHLMQTRGMPRKGGPVHNLGRLAEACLQFDPIMRPPTEIIANTLQSICLDKDSNGTSNHARSQSLQNLPSHHRMLSAGASPPLPHKSGQHHQQQQQQQHSGYSSMHSQHSHSHSHSQQSETYHQADVGYTSAQSIASTESDYTGGAQSQKYGAGHMTHVSSHNEFETASCTSSGSESSRSFPIGGDHAMSDRFSEISGVESTDDSSSGHDEDGSQMYGRQQKPAPSKAAKKTSQGGGGEEYEHSLSKLIALIEEDQDGGIEWTGGLKRYKSLGVMGRAC